MLTRADRAVLFINKLTLTDEFDGLPMRLEPFQEKIVRQLNEVGDDGLTKIRRALVLMPRKQAKSQLAACIAIHHIFGLNRRGLVCLLAATNRYTAGLLFKKIVSIIRASDYLSGKCRIYNSTKRIETSDGNVIQVMSSDGKSVHGENPSLVILDEVWTQTNSDLYDGLTSGFGARKEYLVLLISTQGNRRDSLIYREYLYACKVRDGVLNVPSYLPVIYEASPDDDWTSEDTWRKAMPGLDAFNNIEDLRLQLERAKELVTERVKFLQFNLNLLTASEHKWLDRQKWDRCGEESFDDDELLGRPCFGGVDLASTSDIASAVFVFPWDDGTYRLKVLCWIPRECAEKHDRSRDTTYLQWAEDGLITLTDGDVIDHEFIQQAIVDFAHKHDVREIRIDPFSAMQTAVRLECEGITVRTMNQRFPEMNEPTRSLEVAIARNKLRHNNNDLLTWQAENAVAAYDSNSNVKISKQKSVDKVDSMVALTMAFASVMAEEHAAKIYIGPMN